MIPTFKLLVVGDIGVGKTTAIRKLVGRPFPSKAVSTVALEFYSGSIVIAGKEVRLKFWDISGQKSKVSLGMNYLSEVDAVIVVYDLTSFSTFHCASQWIDSFYIDILDLYQIKKIPIFLFGNKLDLCYKNEGRQVVNQDAELMKKIKGVNKIGSGFVDNNFEKGLIELLQVFLLTDIVFQTESVHQSCCCFQNR